VNRQIGVEESKYRVTCDPPFTSREGSRDLLLKFWDPLHVSGTVGAVKFDMQIHHQGYNAKLSQMGYVRGHVTYF